MKPDEVTRLLPGDLQGQKVLGILKRDGGLVVVLKDVTVHMRSAGGPMLIKRRR